MAMGLMVTVQFELLIGIVLSKADWVVSRDIVQGVLSLKEP